MVNSKVVFMSATNSVSIIFSHFASFICTQLINIKIPETYTNTSINKEMKDKMTIKHAQSSQINS